MIYEKEEDLFKDAVCIQNASNLSGVVRTMEEMLTWMTFQGYDEERKRSHPAIRATMYKIMDMMGIYDIYPLHKDYMECEEKGSLSERSGC